MDNNELTQKYRLFDRDVALFFDRTHSMDRWSNPVRRGPEDEVLIPSADAFAPLEKELLALEDRCAALEQPDPVFALLQSHFTDFLFSERFNLTNLFQQPSLHLDGFMNSFNYLSRKDSRPDGVRMEALLGHYAQADAVWNGISTWLDKVSSANLQSAISICDTYHAAMPVEKTRLAEYFPTLSDADRDRIIRAIDQVGSSMENWVSEMKALAARDAAGQQQAPPSREEYQKLLHDRMGIELSELLRWSDEEMQKTRAAVFECAGRLKVSDPTPRTVKDVVALLDKYAGPCSSPEEMFERANQYLARARAACHAYLELPEERCVIRIVPEYLRGNHPWGGYGGGDPLRRPYQGEMFLNHYNYRALNDGWLKINAIHEAYPGHHIQALRTHTDPAPQLLKLGAKYVPIMEGFAHRSEQLFAGVFEEDLFYPVSVAHRRHHTAVRVKADLMLRYYGSPKSEIVELYQQELGFDLETARGQLRAQEYMPGYFTSYYYGVKKLLEWEQDFSFDAKTYTDLVLSAGRMSLDNFHRFLKLTDDERKRFCNDFASLL